MADVWQPVVAGRIHRVVCWRLDRLGLTAKGLGIYMVCLSGVQYHHPELHFGRGATVLRPWGSLQR